MRRCVHMIRLSDPAKRTPAKARPTVLFDGWMKSRLFELVLVVEMCAVGRVGGVLGCVKRRWATGEISIYSPLWTQLRGFALIAGMF